MTEDVLRRLEAGVMESGELLRAQRARLRSANATRSMVELELVEGKHREVRRLFESQGFPVLSLTRTQIGPIKLGELPLGKYRVLAASEVRALTMAANATPERARADAGAVLNAMRTDSDEGGRR